MARPKKELTPEELEKQKLKEEKKKQKEIEKQKAEEELNKKIQSEKEEIKNAIQNLDNKTIARFIGMCEEYHNLNEDYGINEIVELLFDKFSKGEFRFESKKILF